MSERSESGPSDNPTHTFGSHEGPKPSISGPPASQAAHGSSRVTSPTARAPPLDATRSRDATQLAPPLSTAGSSSASSGTRGGTFSSILNPVQAEESTEAGRRRKAAHMDSPTTSNQSLPPLTSGAHASSAFDSRHSQSPASQYGLPLERPPRRVLTPRSPSLHRTASLGQLSSVSATINAQTTPFPGSPRGGRRYIQEPGVSGAPLLPTPPAAFRPAYGFPTSTAPTPPVDAPQRASRATSRARRASSSASPSTSYSSYSQAEQTSPAAQHESFRPTGGGSAFTGPGSVTGPPTSMELDRHRLSGMSLPAAGGHNGYQMMTLETTAGTVHLPVDVQAASRVADEKRRRNAGASARFRQRRKEKEKDAATSIARLEQQVKALSDAYTFYRAENQYLMNALRHSPGGERHFPRPPSPGVLGGGTSGQMSAPLGVESQVYPLTLEHERAGTEEGRNVRRRTSTYSLPPPPPQPPSNPPPHVGMQGGGFGQGPLPPPRHAVLQPGPERQTPPPPPPPPTAHARAPLPPPSQMASGPPPPPQQPYGPPPVLHAHPQTGPYNPYAPERRSSGPPNQ